MSPTTANIPITRVEKVDTDPSHGEVPGTDAYNIRTQDAVPDEVAIVPDGATSRPTSMPSSPRSVSPSGTPIPKTRVEKVDTNSTSHGDIPGTHAHALRIADAVPDSIVATHGDDEMSSSSPSGESSTPGPIPRTVVTRVDSTPAHGEVPGTEAYKMRLSDADPDVVEKKGDVPSKHIR